MTRDELVASCTAMRKWDDLIFSITNHNYVPTIYPDSAANLKLRGALTEAGHRVHPPQDSLFAYVGYRNPGGGNDDCFDCSFEAALSVLWSGVDALPPLGERVTVKANDAGAGTVVGHRIEYGYAGLWVELDAPCHAPHTGWHEQNVIFIFGVDLEG